ncbi:MAG: DNA cytosine methyltransferase [Caulobacterales bacterium]|jgi:DNA (cytosine-5)-methyltransferase 1
MSCDSGAALYEFFAGGGMARMGLSSHWTTTFANDIDPAKAAAYRAAHGGQEMVCADVWALTSTDLPGRPGLAWASFPCQDISLAGARGGLAAPRSGAFWGFWRLIEALDDESRAPPLLALENVSGLATSAAGADLAALVAALARRGYRVGAVEIDAAHFTPQSRPRLFLVAARGPIPAGMTAPAGLAPFASPALVRAVARFDAKTTAAWVWWRMAPAPKRNVDLAQIVDPSACCWWSPAKTAALIDLMAPVQRARLDAMIASGARYVGAAFRRVRSENGVKRQRAEARFDGIAGCLRTPAGGSSRQILLVIDEGEVKARLMTAREGARLMGLRDDYPLPKGETAALHLIGDGLCVPAVKFLNDALLKPLATATRAQSAAA